MALWDMKPSFMFFLSLSQPASGESPKQGKLSGIWGLAFLYKTFALYSRVADFACSELIGATEGGPHPTFKLCRLGDAHRLVFYLFKIFNLQLFSQLNR